MSSAASVSSASSRIAAAATVAVRRGWARSRRCCWKQDRLGRSLPHLIETVGGLEQRGVGFRSITEAIDTTTPGGRLVFHLFGALGQFERDLIRERTRAGLDAAAARGRKGGPKAVVTAEKLERARAIIAKGLTVREAATRLKVGKTALYGALKPA
jgi:DNA invertase Pin-like site-specific DNA recombinase